MATKPVTVDSLKGEHFLELVSEHTARRGKSLSIVFTVDEGWGVQFVLTFRDDLDVTTTTVTTLAAAVRRYNEFDARTRPSVLRSRR